MKTANILTISRLILVPVLVVVFCIPGRVTHYAAAAIFFIAAVTDYFDGYFARKENNVTRFGAFLDPVADKLMVVLVLLLLVSSGGGNHIYLTIPAIIIVAREFLISALREWMAEIGKRTSVAVGMVGKVKTVLQMAAILVLLLYYPGMSKSFYWSGILLLYLAVILTLWSMVMYIKAAWPDLTFSEEK